MSQTQFWSKSSTFGDAVLRRERQPVHCGGKKYRIQGCLRFKRIGHVTHTIDGWRWTVQIDGPIDHVSGRAKSEAEGKRAVEAVLQILETP